MSDSNNTVLPIRFNPQLMADQNREFIGVVPVQDMQRLQQQVLSAESMVAVTMRFSSGEYGYPAVTGRIEHTLGLRCERCLDEVQIKLNLPIHVSIKPESEYLTENPENVDFYEYDGKNLEIAEFIEHELLLALPLVPRHQDISLCNRDMIAWLASNEGPAGKAQNPFAILKR